MSKIIQEYTRKCIDTNLMGLEFCLVDVNALGVSSVWKCSMWPMAAALVLLACKDSTVVPDSTLPLLANTGTAPQNPKSDPPGVATQFPKNLGPSARMAQAPDVFRVLFATSKGKFIIQAHREWSPGGADRFYELATKGFYNDTRFYRVINGFMVQFGLNGSPAVNSAWRAAHIPDDHAKQSNKRGFVSYAMAGPGTRTTQIFINYNDNTHLDRMGFTPFGQVIEGMDVVDSLVGYGESTPSGQGPDQGHIQRRGNAYLDEVFPRLDRIHSASIVELIDMSPAFRAS